MIGATIGYYADVPQRVVAGLLAFGSGVLISAISFDLMEEAFARGGFAATAIGFKMILRQKKHTSDQIRSVNAFRALDNAEHACVL